MDSNDNCSTENILTILRFAALKSYVGKIVEVVYLEHADDVLAPNHPCNAIVVGQLDSVSIFPMGMFRITISWRTAGDEERFAQPAERILTFYARDKVRIGALALDDYGQSSYLRTLYLQGGARGHL